MPSYRRLRYYVQDDVPIYKYYFGDFKLDIPYSAPYRKDRNPSFVITVSEWGNLYWKDWGISDQEYLDGIGFVMYRYGCNRQEAIDLIWKDLVIDKGIKEVSSFKIQTKPKKKLPYTYEAGEMEDWELDYWYQHLIPQNMLNYYNVKALRALYRDGTLITQSVEGNPTYLYIKPDSDDVFKSYAPLDDYYKWGGQANGNWIQGWDQLPYRAEHLFITSSLKDVMVQKTMGIVSCAPPSENSLKALIKKMDEINGRFRNVFILFDSDYAGIKSAKKLAQKSGFKWTPVFLPFHWKTKDTAEVVKKVGNHLRVNEFFSNLVENRYYRI